MDIMEILKKQREMLQESIDRIDQLIAEEEANLKKNGKTGRIVPK
jgi:hypothetical protein